VENPILEALQLTLKELAFYLPKILFSIGIAVVYVLVALAITRITRKILKLIRIDSMFKSFFNGTINISDVVIGFINVGLALLAIYTLTSILLPEYLHSLTLMIGYIGRIAGVIFAVFFAFILLNSMVERVKMGAKVKEFMFITTLSITLILIVDAAAVSEEVKASIAWGISLGLGLAIGAFAAWYYFHEYLGRKPK